MTDEATSHVHIKAFAYLERFARLQRLIIALLARGSATPQEMQQRIGGRDALTAAINNLVNLKIIIVDPVIRIKYKLNSNFKP